jgi:hypothetical protein
MSRPRRRKLNQVRALDVCVDYNILLLGKRGHGKSTLGNRMLNFDGSFKINDQQYPQTTMGSFVHRSLSQPKNCKIYVYDHTGLFEGASSVDTLPSAMPDKLNLIVFVLKHRHTFDESEMEILESVMSAWNIMRISALVLTHCDHISEKERGEMIKQFKRDHPSIAELMGKGIFAVGFPDSSIIRPGSLLSRKVEEDKIKLKQLIYSCDVVVPIPKPPPNEIMNRQYPQTKTENLFSAQNRTAQPVLHESRQPPQNENNHSPRNRSEQPVKNYQPP